MGRMTEKEARDILEIGPYATRHDVKSAYKRLALICHPDEIDNDPESTMQFQKISAAYDRLTKDNINDEDIQMEKYDDNYNFQLLDTVFKSERNVTRVHVDGGFFLLMGPRGSSQKYSDESEDDYDYSKYSFRAEADSAEVEPKTKAEKNKIKKLRQNKNKKLAMENLKQEREEIKQERQKYLEETKSTPENKSHTEVSKKENKNSSKRKKRKKSNSQDSSKIVSEPQTEKKTDSTEKIVEVDKPGKSQNDSKSNKNESLRETLDSADTKPVTKNEKVETDSAKSLDTKTSGKMSKSLKPPTQNSPIPEKGKNLSKPPTRNSPVPEKNKNISTPPTQNSPVAGKTGKKPPPPTRNSPVAEIDKNISAPPTRSSPESEKDKHISSSPTQNSHVSEKGKNTSKLSTQGSLVPEKYEHISSPTQNSPVPGKNKNTSQLPIVAQDHQTPVLGTPGINTIEARLPENELFSSQKEIEGSSSQREIKDKEQATEADIDGNYAFFGNVAQKQNLPAAVGAKPKTKNVSPMVIPNYPQPQTSNEMTGQMMLSPVQVRAQHIASEGNKKASEGRYLDAVTLYSQALLVNPTDFIILGNRSFCLDKLGHYEKALIDASKAIYLAPLWSKGYFRKAKALFGMMQYPEAERAFEYVLRLDKHCQEAELEIQNVRVRRMQEMGFSKQQSILAIKKFHTVDHAVERLLASALPPDLSLEDIYVSDEDDMEEDNLTETFQQQLNLGIQPSNMSNTINPIMPQPLNTLKLFPSNIGQNDDALLVKSSFATTEPIIKQGLTKSDQSLEQDSKMNSKIVPPRMEQKFAKSVASHATSTSWNHDSENHNPRRKTRSSIFVGNLTSKVKAKSVIEYFSQFGPLHNFSTSKYNHMYGFVNYYNEESAKLAMDAGHLVTIDGAVIVLDYPGSKTNLYAYQDSRNPVGIDPTHEERMKRKKNRQASEGREECKYWRKAGCYNGPDCANLHLPKSQGVDMWS